jgi:hypothetical protein
MITDAHRRIKRTGAGKVSSGASVIVVDHAQRG